MQFCVDLIDSNKCFSTFPLSTTHSESSEKHSHSVMLQARNYDDTVYINQLAHKVELKLF